MVAIVRSAHRWMRLHARCASAFEPELPADVLDALGQLSPRLLIRALEDGHARAAAEGRSRLRLNDVIVPAKKDLPRIGSF